MAPWNLGKLLLWETYSLKLSSNCIPSGPLCVRILLWNARLPGRAPERRGALLERKCACTFFPAGRIIRTSSSEGKRVPKPPPIIAKMRIADAADVSYLRSRTAIRCAASDMDTGQPLSGQVAVITGAGRGIGAAIARKLASLGATSVLCGRTQSTLDSTARAILDAGGKTEVIPCDVTPASPA